MYGDDVNIASRVEGFSPEGGISISDKVYKDVNFKLTPIANTPNWIIPNDNNNSVFDFQAFSSKIFAELNLTASLNTRMISSPV